MSQLIIFIESEYVELVHHLCCSTFLRQHHRGEASVLGIELQHHRGEASVLGMELQHVSDKAQGECNTQQNGVKNRSRAPSAREWFLSSERGGFVDKFYVKSFHTGMTL